jgi:hypothetical protein
MPITRRWADDDHSILVLEYDGIVPGDELYPAFQEAIQELQGIDHPVHVIIDHSRETITDESFAEMLPKMGAMELPPNMGLLIQVATRGQVRARTDLYSQMYRKMHQVDVIEEALALIKVYEQRRTAGDPS